MGWNEATYEILGGSDESAEARDELAVLERWIGGVLPESVREWYLLGGDRRLASISSNLVTQTRDFASPRVSRFLDSGYLLLETDRQHCCRWAVAVSAAHGWAMNQGCDAVYRFSGPAKVAVAVTGSTALWSAIAASSTARRDALATLIGATPGD